MINKRLTAALLMLALGSAFPAFGQNVSQSTQVGNSNATAGATNTTSVAAGSTSSATGGNPNATASSGGSATSTSGASRSVSGVILNMYGSGSGSTGSSGSGLSGDSAGNTGSGGTDPTTTIKYTGGYTVHNTPDAPAPAMYGGTNPCAVGMSAGVAVAGFGMSAGSTWSDHGCERRNSAVILFQAKMPDVAVALLCQDHDIRTAFSEAGQPCPQDRHPAVSAVAPMAAAPARAVAASTGTQPAAPAVLASTTAARKPASTGYGGPKPKFCNERAKSPTDEAFQRYYCRG